MKDDENDAIVELLQLAAAYDRRTIGEGDVAAWADAARMARWDLSDAQDAVRTHYSRSTAYLMPGHVTELLRAERRQPPDYARNQKALPRPKADPQTIRDGVDKVVASLAAKRAIKLGLDPDEAAETAEGEAGARRLIRSVTCPHCHAAVGQPCVRRSRRQDEQKELTGYHPARADLAMGGAAA